MHILLFFTICVVIIATGESIQCYNCVDGPDHIPGLHKCILPFSINDTNQKCTEEHGYCMKGTGSFDGHSIVMRQCIPIVDVIPNIKTHELPAPTEPVEMQFGDVRLTANICLGNLCNAASILNARISLAIVFLSIFLNL
ncbi:uncharacterized protein LOC127286622 [Leptopilina boulardi]|uniref:uncharacterized protein LOC127286622 n=1 Tax=Leptopilina boulardi TaxID=63433 RepID=UPI0021F5A43F|nr:uncharacterized protein LOC127286622 [Leptopilina boulardi]